MTEMKMQALPDESHLMGVFARLPIQFVRGNGMELFDADGTRYFDFLSGIGTVNLGHRHPAVTSALHAQADVLTHVSNFFYIEHRAELADKLVELFGSEAQVFFANSGAEVAFSATECFV